MNTERQMLRQTVAALVAKQAGPEQVRRAMESDRGYDEALWTTLCEQVGAAALIVPEEYGGAGGELADAAAVLEELGRGLVPTPLFATTVAEAGLLAADTPDTGTLEHLAAGSLIGTVAFDSEYVVSGDVADVVLAINDGRVVRWTEATAEPLTPLDPTRRLARLTSGSTSDIGPDPGLADIAAVLLAAEQIGSAARCLELTVEYTKQRVQFGRPIGSFQALKHRMADLYVALQSARAVVSEAVSKVTPVNAARARLAASETFCTVAGEAIQLHGGIAITWEHDIQLYFKRAHSSAQLLGAPREQVRRLESEIL